MRHDSRIEVAVRQCFGNCPKYIQRRQRLFNSAYGEIHGQQISVVDQYLRLLFKEVELVFIASKLLADTASGNGGIDVSHRGGRPGFIEIDEEGRLLMPDFAGNNFFNTLGNLKLDPDAGLLVPDYKHGHLIHLYCRAEILWRNEHPGLCGNYERVLRFTVREGRIVYNRMPYLWRNIE